MNHEKAGSEIWMLSEKDIGEKVKVTGEECSPLHYAKVVKTRFEVVNFDKLIFHQFSMKISQIFNDYVSKHLKKLTVSKFKKSFKKFKSF